MIANSFSPFELKLSPPLDSVFEQLAGGAFDKAQVIIVTKMLMVTAEAARAQVRQEMREELSAMRADYGRLIIEAVEATEAKIFARLEEEKAKEEEKKKERRELAAARKREREAQKEQECQAASGQAELFEDDPVNDPALMEGWAEMKAEEEAKRNGTYTQPASQEIAYKFEDLPEYKALMDEWEKQAAKDEPRKPSGSPMAAMQSLGEAMVASWKKQEEEERRAQEQGNVLMLEKGASVEMGQAAQ